MLVKILTREGGDIPQELPGEDKQRESLFRPFRQ
jgi:hypothetical protein